MSRQRSGRAASAAPRTATRAAGRAPTARGVYVQQPKSDIFVVMLSIALGAMLLGCLLLLLVWGRYDYKTGATAMIVPSLPSLTSLAADAPRIFS